uniref:uncharacterized protein LOC122586047 n=1 Tax=Erigeron canadensis TaxID=72917 RepID=UPI001CB995AC|nr:uncharacterized protein LOC122586047 [Erigeron canadensis]
MMKSTKPISSPGRTTEKFPPPLMRFLRSNVGNKSTKRGGRRSRASPMFFRRKNTNIEAIQEPSSPKVTCIGQVRVRRSKKTTTATTTSNVATTAGSAAVLRRKSRNIICRCFRKLKPRSIFNVLSKWVSFFRCGYCESSTFLDDSPVDVCAPVSVIKQVAGKNGDEQEKEEEQEDINQGLISKSPPKNAFLLTRCRSAPYRSSSLANKFWESGMEKKEEEEISEKIKNLKIKKEDENENVEVNEGGSKCNERNEVEELKAVKEVPLILNRCKSEPARTWKQLLIV